MKLSEGMALCRSRFGQGAFLAFAVLCSCLSPAAADEADCIITPSEKDPPSLKLTHDSERQATALASFMEGLFEEESEGPDKAIASYRKVLDADPSFTGLAVKLASDYQRKGQTDEAVSVLKDAINAKPDEPDPCLMLSAIYLRQLHKPQLALKYANMALDASPALFSAYETLWEIDRSQGEAARAAKVIQKAARSGSTDPDFWLQLAQLQARDILRTAAGGAGDNGSGAFDGTDVRQWNRLSAGSVAKIGVFLQKALAVANGDPEVIAKSADFYVLLREIGKAAPLYRKAAAIKPDLPSVRVKLVACYLEMGDNDNAIRTLEDIVKDDPLNTDAYDQLAKLYRMKDNLERALANEEQALLIASPDILRYRSVIQLCLGVGQFQKALDHVNDAFLRFPKNPEFLLYQGIALGECKRHQEALKAFEEALVEAGTTQPEYLNADFYFYYGEAAEQAGQYAKAEELFRKSIDLDPSQAARAYNYLGFMWVDHNENLEEAGKFIRKALEAEPKNGAYLDSLGWYYFRKGQYQEALSELLRAVGTFPEADAEVCEHIGWAYERLGMKTEAALYWQKSLKLAPDNRELSAALDRITQKVAEQPKPAGVIGKP